MASPKLNLVVAACNNRGIGIKGQLPWKIKGDMAFFKQITSQVKHEGTQNAVIMGRKTWESIPAKFRPLPNRINIVITKTLKGVPEGVCLAGSMEEAIAILQSDLMKPKLGDVFVIGGHSIYKVAMESPHCHRIYLTQVLADFECDVHMPEIDPGRFQLQQDPSIDHSIQSENGLQYKFEVYEKVASH